MKIIVVLPDGSRQPLEVPEQVTVRRLLPALAEKVNLPRRDEAGTAVAYYATRHTVAELAGLADLSALAQQNPIPDDQSLADLGFQDNDIVLLHPVVVADPHEVVEAEPEAQPEVPHLPRSRPIRRPRERSSRLRQLARIGCVMTLAAVCCIPVTIFAWLTYAIVQEVRSQSAISEPVAEVVTFTESSWNFVVTDAVYNAAIERLVMISSDPHQLHIYDPSSGQDVQIPLAHRPTAVAVNGNGGSAVVGHEGLVSLVNLERQSVSQTMAVEATIYDAAVAENGWVYFSTTGEDKDSVYGLEIESGAEHMIVVPHTNEMRLLQLAPDGRSLYSTTGGPEAGRLEKIDIAQGEPRFLYDSGGVVDTCGGVWLAENGRLAVTGCGHIWGLADRKQDDMVLRGSFFETPTKIRTLTHSAAAGRILLIAETADNQVQIFDSERFELLDRLTLPEGGHGRFIFTKAEGNQYYVIIETDAGEFGLVRGNL